jgi:hypothetical protein
VPESVFARVINGIRVNFKIAYLSYSWKFRGEEMQFVSGQRSAMHLDKSPLKYNTYCSRRQLLHHNARNITYSQWHYGNFLTDPCCIMTHAFIPRTQDDRHPLEMRYSHHKITPNNTDKKFSWWFRLQITVLATTLSHNCATLDYN